jgi:hypothetical protein
MSQFTKLIRRRASVVTLFLEQQRATAMINQLSGETAFECK